MGAIAGLQAAFTIGSAYISARYTFLGRAPLLLKVTAFAFFSATTLVLGVFMLVATRYADGVATALTDLHVKKQLSGLGGLVAVMLNHTPDVHICRDFYYHGHRNLSRLILFNIPF